MASTVKESYHINAPIEDVWRALVGPGKVKKWPGGPTKIKNKEVVENKKLVQDWKLANWDKSSLVTITLYKEDQGTLVDLLQEGVPDEDADNIEDGWDKHYFGSIKKYLESR